MRSILIIWMLFFSAINHGQSLLMTDENHLLVEYYGIANASLSRSVHQLEPTVFLKHSHMKKPLLHSAASIKSDVRKTNFFEPPSDLATDMIIKPFGNLPEKVSYLSPKDVIHSDYSLIFIKSDKSEGRIAYVIELARIDENYGWGVGIVVNGIR